MESLRLEDIDLSLLVDALRQQLGDRLDASYLRGKTVFRDTLVGYLGCSDYEAEGLVETLELHGLLRFPHLDDATHPSDRHRWRVG